MPSSSSVLINYCKLTLSVSKIGLLAVSRTAKHLLSVLDTSLLEEFRARETIMEIDLT